jgi:hypothetical protein
MVTLTPIIAAIAGILIYLDFSRRERKMGRSSNAIT